MRQVYYAGREKLETAIIEKEGIIPTEETEIRTERSNKAEKTNLPGGSSMMPRPMAASHRPVQRNTRTGNYE